MRWWQKLRAALIGGGSVADLSGQGTYRALREQGGSLHHGIPGDWRMIGRDGKPILLSRGHVTINRAAFDRIGPDGLAALNAGESRPPVRPDITVVEPDGTLTEIEGDWP